MITRIGKSVIGGVDSLRPPFLKVIRKCVPNFKFEGFTGMLFPVFFIISSVAFADFDANDSSTLSAIYDKLSIDIQGINAHISENTSDIKSHTDQIKRDLSYIRTYQGSIEWELTTSKNHISDIKDDLRYYLPPIKSASYDAYIKLQQIYTYLQNMRTLQYDSKLILESMDVRLEQIEGFSEYFEDWDQLFYQCIPAISNNCWMIYSEVSDGHGGRTTLKDLVRSIANNVTNRLDRWDMLVDAVIDLSNSAHGISQTGTNLLVNLSYPYSSNGSPTQSYEWLDYDGNVWTGNYDSWVSYYGLPRYYIFSLFRGTTLSNNLDLFHKLPESIRSRIRQLNDLMYGYRDFFGDSQEYDKINDLYMDLYNTYVLTHGFESFTNSFYLYSREVLASLSTITNLHGEILSNLVAIKDAITGDALDGQTLTYPTNAVVNFSLEPVANDTFDNILQDIQNYAGTDVNGSIDAVVLDINRGIDNINNLPTSSSQSILSTWSILGQTFHFTNFHLFNGDNPFRAKAKVITDWLLVGWKIACVIWASITILKKVMLFNESFDYDNGFEGGI